VAEPSGSAPSTAVTDQLVTLDLPDDDRTVPPGRYTPRSPRRY